METPQSSLKQQGLQALQDGRLEQAIDFLSRAVLTDESDTDARALLGIAYSQKGLHDQARRVLESVIAAQPDNANYRYNLGIAAQRAGDLAAAAAAFRDVLRVNPQHSQARAKLRELGPQAAEDSASSHTASSVSSSLSAAPSPSGAVPVVPPVSPPGNGTQPPLSETRPPLAGTANDIPTEPPLAGSNVPAAPTASPVGSEGAMPTGMVQCPSCGKYSPIGMLCQVCDAPLPPPSRSQPATPGGSPQHSSHVPPYASSAMPELRAAPHYSQPNRSGLILGLGIASLLLMCVPLGAVTWVMANRDLQARERGEMEPAGSELTQTGRVLAILSTVLGVICLGFNLLSLISALAEVSRAAGTG